MKYHWMDRGSSSSLEEFKKISKEANEVGYYSLLLTYSSFQPDLLLKSAMIADNNIKTKFMLAIRTYAISPEYMSMICASYNEIFPNKLILNIVSGDIHDGETSIEDIPLFSNFLNTPDKRLDYTYEWVEKFLKISKKWYTPEIIMSGHSDKTKIMAKNFKATHLSMLNMYIDEIENKNRIINEKQMISLSILIRNTKKEAEEFLSHNGGDRVKQWTIYGNDDDILQEIENLKKIGVSDIIISKNEKDKEYQKIHKLIKSIR